MNLLEFENALKAAREQGADDMTPVWAVSKAMDYSRKVKKVEFNANCNWPRDEWPVVIEITE